jgi:hypothetical protein
MAHGELMMIGAYATYVVQNVFRAYFPGVFDAYVIVAIPIAFLTSALVGVIVVAFAFERIVNLVHALPQQEQPATDQYQVASRDFLHQREQRLRQLHDPCKGQQQQDARQHRQPEAESPRDVAPGCGQASATHAFGSPIQSSIRLARRCRCYRTA